MEREGTSVRLAGEQPIIADAQTVGRSQVEDFLYYEAHLLDRWLLNEWLELFDEDAVYLVPSTDNPHGNPDLELFLITDDMAILRARVKRLMSDNAHREFPHSLTRRFVTNVLVTRAEASQIVVTASFLVYRTRAGTTDFYVGHYENTLRISNGCLRFAVRKAVLDMEALRPAGTLSIIL